MSAHVARSEVWPGGRPPAAPVAHVAVLVSLNFPEMDESVAELVRRFTRVALETLWSVGATFELIDSSDPLGQDDRAQTCDGLLVLGGGDIDPTCYGPPLDSVANSYGVDRRADEDSLAIIAEAERTGRPILGICRGAQLINVHRGGTIIPDIEDHVLHRGGPDEPMFLDETIRIVPGTRLHHALGADRVTGRAGHHQAVDTVGADLVVTARALDGIVEGIEDPDRWVVGVQWHPEDDDGPAEDRERLFAAFVDACAAAAAVSSDTPAP